MPSALMEIATELAIQYPLASAQQIADVMIDAIESGPIISDAISYVTIPSQLQLKQAEFKTKRLPSKHISRDEAKKREALLAHIDNAHLLKQIKSLYIVPLEDAGPGPIIGLDGARVDLLPSFQRPDATFKSSPQRRRLNSNGTNQSTAITQAGGSTVSTESTVYYLPSRSTWETTFSPLEFLTEVEEETNHLFSLYDIYRIITFLYLYPEDSNLTMKIDEAIRNDIKNRNRESRSDCLEELYRGDDQLPEELRVPFPKSSDFGGITVQRIKAIIIDEYQRLQNEVAQKFTNGEITYHEFVQAEGKDAAFADELLAALP